MLPDITGTMKNKTENINRTCFVRNEKCKRIFESTQICFIASPAHQEVAWELERIKTLLRKKDIEPYIAVEEFNPQKDIYCEKICSKIIESQFCIVILNEVTYKINEKEVKMPNPNVYYEYGFMTALNKKIIPIQIQDQKLAFNIQGLDTVK